MTPTPDSEMIHRVVTLESALRIIVTLSTAFSSSDDDAQLRACMRQIARTAKEAMVDK